MMAITEASLVDDTQIYPPYIYEDSSLGYWPSFSSLSPEARGAYLVGLPATDATLPAQLVTFSFIAMVWKGRLLTWGQQYIRR